MAVMNKVEPLIPLISHASDPHSGFEKINIVRGEVRLFFGLAIGIQETRKSKQNVILD
jgi:hypothetical protein